MGASGLTGQWHSHVQTFHTMCMHHGGLSIAVDENTSTCTIRTRQSLLAAVEGRSRPHYELLLHSRQLPTCAPE